jgi:hypothetical protein
MSERKVLTKYYPPDFDPSKIVRTRSTKDSSSAPKLATVRLMAPFSMRCTSCGEYIYKGRKFNARKETTEEKYYAISIFRFYIRCTRCSGEITFKTDPKNMDYVAERGARRNFEPWRERKEVLEESDEARLDRLEREEADMEGDGDGRMGEKSKMEELEERTEEARKEMRVADALDEIRLRNARLERGERGDVVESVMGTLREKGEGEREGLERELEKEARRVFRTHEGERVKRLVEDGEQGVGGMEGVKDEKTDMPPPPPVEFKKVVKKKKEPFKGLGIKKKMALV